MMLKQNPAWSVGVEDGQKRSCLMVTRDGNSLKKSLRRSKDKFSQKDDLWFFCQPITCSINL